MISNLKDQLSTTFRALRHENYRLFFIGQLISLTGTWIEIIAINWLVYELTGSALIMGTITFVTSLPTLLTPFSGVIVDRYNKFKLLKLVQFFFMAQALCMAFLNLAGIIQVWHIVVLGLILNFIVALDMPARQAIVVDLVDDHDDIGNAISLNSACFNIARLIGPAVGGFLVAGVGVGVCFLINAISFIAVIIAISLMKDKGNVKHDEKEGVLIELKNGFEYIKQKKQILNLIIFVGVISLIGMSYPIMLPILTKDVYLSDARLLGYFMSAAGFGALTTTLLLASKKTMNKMPEFLMSGAFLLSFAFILMGFARIKLLSILLMFLIGCGVVTCLIVINTLIQFITNDEKRGRVMSIHALAFAGSMPFGNLLTGYVAQYLGIMNTFISYGVLIFIFGLIFSRKILNAKYEQDI